MEKQGVLPVPVRRNRGMDVPSDSLEFHDLIQSCAVDNQTWHLYIGQSSLRTGSLARRATRPPPRESLFAGYGQSAVVLVEEAGSISHDN